ncbi:MAG: acetamidase/formamidase family protein [Nibricoccus sp.]
MKVSASLCVVAALSAAFCLGLPEQAFAAPFKIDHHLPSTPETVNGHWWAGAKPALRIKSGEVVEIDTVSLGGFTDDNPEKFFIDQGISPDLPVVKELIAIKKAIVADPASKGQAVNLTGPIFIEGAMPGDVLEVRILAIKSRLPYGVNSGRPGGGGVPDLVPRPYSKVIKLDLKRNVGLFSDTIEVPLRQFMGKVGVSPVLEKGKLHTSPPYQETGGNYDNKYATTGTTFFFPVQVEGALFQTGDPHAAQGNGEVSGSAIESSDTVVMQFFLRKDMKLKYPRMETPTHFIAIGVDPDLDKAMHTAIAETITFLQEWRKLDFFDSLALASVAVDYETTQVVDGTKGIHGMIPKSIFKDYKPESYWFKPADVPEGWH